MKAVAVDSDPAQQRIWLLFCIDNSGKSGIILSLSSPTDMVFILQLEYN